MGSWWSFPPDVHEAGGFAEFMAHCMGIHGKLWASKFEPCVFVFLRRSDVEPHERSTTFLLNSYGDFPVELVSSKACVEVSSEMFFWFVQPGLPSDAQRKSECG